MTHLQSTVSPHNVGNGLCVPIMHVLCYVITRLLNKKQCIPFL